MHIIDATVGVDATKLGAGTVTVPKEIVGDARKLAGFFGSLLAAEAAEWEARFGEPVAWGSVLAVLGHLIAGFSVSFDQDEDLDIVLTQVGNIAKGFLPEVREFRRRFEAGDEEGARAVVEEATKAARATK